MHYIIYMIYIYIPINHHPMSGCGALSPKQPQREWPSGDKFHSRLSKLIKARASFAMVMVESAVMCTHVGCVWNVSML